MSEALTLSQNLSVDGSAEPITLEIEESEEDIEEDPLSDAPPVSITEETVAEKPVEEVSSVSVEEEEHSLESEEEEDEPSTIETPVVDILQRPNNIPFEGYHKEIIPRPNKPGRVIIYIYPPKKYEGIIKAAIGVYRIQNAKELTLYLAEIKKNNISLPPGITKANFGKFYTKASSLNESDKKLLDAHIALQKKEKKEKYESDEEEGEGDDEEDEDEGLYAKLDQELHQQILIAAHPEIRQIDFDELNALSRIVRDTEGKIIDGLHQTIPFMTKYERARILGIRAKQLNNGAPPFIPLTEEMIDGYSIAKSELMEKKIPFIIRRPIPNGASEYWRIADLEILH